MPRDAAAFSSNGCGIDKSAMAPRAFITGLAGPTLTADERAFLRDAAPWGLILFKRNIVDPAQVTCVDR